MDSYICHSGYPNYQITAIVFLFSDQFGKGEGWLEVDSTWLIHYKNTDGSGSLGGPQAKRGKTTRVYLERGKQNKMCAFVNMWMTISCSWYTIIHTEVGPGFRKEPTNDFHRTLDDVWQLFCYGVWSTGPCTHIFSDFQLVNIYQMTQMRAKPDCLGSHKNNHWHWQIEGPLI